MLLRTARVTSGPVRYCAWYVHQFLALPVWVAQCWQSASSTQAKLLQLTACA